MDRAQLVFSALTAFGTIGAAWSALYIATRDREDRKPERDAADLAQARLVKIEIKRPGTYEYSVRVRNYAAQPILDVCINSASLHTDPDATWRAPGERQVLEIIEPDRESLSEETLRLEFIDVDVDGNEKRTAEEPMPSQRVLRQLVVDDHNAAPWRGDGEAVEEQVAVHQGADKVLDEDRLARLVLRGQHYPPTIRRQPVDEIRRGCVWFGQ
nr:hypothetical protein [Mycobacterium numidiamassiliense]